MRSLLATAVLLVAVTPRPGSAAVCEYKLGETVRVTGAYVPSRQPYARGFVFALQLDCGGTTDLVTVQRPTGNLPVCKPQEQVEVVGKLIWNKSLVDGHYEINSPSSVTCRGEARTTTSTLPPDRPLRFRPAGSASRRPPGRRRWRRARRHPPPRGPSAPACESAGTRTAAGRAT